MRIDDSGGSSGLSGILAKVAQLVQEAAGSAAQSAGPAAPHGGGMGRSVPMFSATAWPGMNNGNQGVVLTSYTTTTETKHVLDDELAAALDKVRQAQEEKALALERKNAAKADADQHPDDPVKQVASIDADSDYDIACKKEQSAVDQAKLAADKKEQADAHAAGDRERAQSGKVSDPTQHRIDLADQQVDADQKAVDADQKAVTAAQSDKAYKHSKFVIEWRQANGGRAFPGFEDNKNVGQIESSPMATALTFFNMLRSARDEAVKAAKHAEVVSAMANAEIDDRRAQDGLDKAKQGGNQDEINAAQKNLDMVRAQDAVRYAHAFAKYGQEDTSPAVIKARQDFLQKASDYAQAEKIAADKSGDKGRMDNANRRLDIVHAEGDLAAAQAALDEIDRQIAAGSQDPSLTQKRQQAQQNLDNAKHKLTELLEGARGTPASDVGGQGVLPPDVASPARTAAYVTVGPGDSLWSIALYILDDPRRLANLSGADPTLKRQLDDDQAQGSHASARQKTQWVVDALERQNPQFDPKLQDGNPGTIRGAGQGGRDPDLLYDGEKINIGAEPVSSTPSNSPYAPLTNQQLADQIAADQKALQSPPKQTDPDSVWTAYWIKVCELNGMKAEWEDRHQGNANNAAHTVAGLDVFDPSRGQVALSAAQWNDRAQWLGLKSQARSLDDQASKLEAADPDGKNDATRAARARANAVMASLLQKTCEIDSTLPADANSTKITHVDPLTGKTNISLTADQWRKRAAAYGLEATASKFEADDLPDPATRESKQFKTRAARAAANAAMSAEGQLDCQIYASSSSDPNAKITGIDPITGQVQQWANWQWSDRSDLLGLYVTEQQTRHDYLDAKARGVQGAALDAGLRTWYGAWLHFEHARLTDELNADGTQEDSLKRDIDALKARQAQGGLNATDTATLADEQHQWAIVHDRRARDLTSLQARTDEEARLGQGGGALDPTDNSVYGPGTLKDPSDPKDRRGHMDVWAGGGLPWVPFTNDMDPTYGLDPISAGDRLHSSDGGTTFKGSVQYHGETFSVTVTLQRDGTVEVKYTDENGVLFKTDKRADAAKLWKYGVDSWRSRKHNDDVWSWQGEAYDIAPDDMVPHMVAWTNSDHASKIESDFTALDSRNRQLQGQLQVAQAHDDVQAILQLQQAIADLTPKLDAAKAMRAALHKWQEVDRLVRSRASDEVIGKARLEAMQAEGLSDEADPNRDPGLRRLARQKADQIGCTLAGLDHPNDLQAKLRAAGQISVDGFYRGFGTAPIDIQSEAHLRNTIAYAVFGPRKGNDSHNRAWATLSSDQLRADLLSENALFDQLDEDQKKEVRNIAKTMRQQAGGDDHPLRATVLRGAVVDKSGEVNPLTLFGVSDDHGKGHIVDVDGGNYDNIADYRNHNNTMDRDGALSVLPVDKSVKPIQHNLGRSSYVEHPMDAKPVYTADGHIDLDSFGDARHMSGWEKFEEKHHLDAWITGATIVLSVAAFIPTGGASTALVITVATARLALAGAMAYGAGSSAADIASVAQHGQNWAWLPFKSWQTSLDWLNLAASVVPLPSMIDSGVRELSTAARKLSALERDVVQTESALAKAKPGTPTWNAAKTAFDRAVTVLRQDGPGYRATMLHELPGAAMKFSGQAAKWLGGTAFVANTVSLVDNMHNMSDEELQHAYLMLVLNAASMLPFHRLPVQRLIPSVRTRSEQNYARWGVDPHAVSSSRVAVSMPPRTAASRTASDPLNPFRQMPTTTASSASAGRPQDIHIFSPDDSSFLRVRPTNRGQGVSHGTAVTPRARTTEAVANANVPDGVRRGGGKRVVAALRRGFNSARRVALKKFETAAMLGATATGLGAVAGGAGLELHWLPPEIAAPFSYIYRGSRAAIQAAKVRRVTTRVNRGADQSLDWLNKVLVRRAARNGISKADRDEIATAIETLRRNPTDADALAVLRSAPNKIFVPHSKLSTTLDAIALVSLGISNGKNILLFMHGMNYFDPATWKTIGFAIGNATLFNRVAFGQLARLRGLKKINQRIFAKAMAPATMATYSIGGITGAVGQFIGPHGFLHTIPGGPVQAAVKAGLYLMFSYGAGKQGINDYRRNFLGKKPLPSKYSPPLAILGVALVANQLIDLGHAFFGMMALPLGGRALRRLGIGRNGTVDTSIDAAVPDRSEQTPSSPSHVLRLGVEHPLAQTVNPTNDDGHCVNCAVTLDWLLGRQAQGLPVDGDSALAAVGSEPVSFAHVRAVADAGPPQEFGSVDEAMNELLLTLPANSRGFIDVQRPEGRHTLNFVRTDDGVDIIDAQAGHRVDEVKSPSVRVVVTKRADAPAEDPLALDPRRFVHVRTARQRGVAARDAVPPQERSGGIGRRRQRRQVLASAPKHAAVKDVWPAPKPVPKMPPLQRLMSKGMERRPPPNLYERFMFDERRLKLEIKGRRGEWTSADKRIAKLEAQRRTILAKKPRNWSSRAETLAQRIDTLHTRRTDLAGRILDLQQRLQLIDERRALPAMRQRLGALAARHDELQQRAASLQASQASPLDIKRARQEILKLEARQSRLQAEVNRLSRPLGVSGIGIDPLLLEMMALPALPRGAAADIHAHLYGYDFRAGSTRDRRAAAQSALAELRYLHASRGARIRARMVSRISARLWTTIGIETLLASAPTSTRVLFGNIPQYCGESHYSHANAPQLSTGHAGRMDQQLAAQLMRHWVGYEEAKAKGDDAAAQAHALVLARADASATGVVMGVDPETYLKNLLIEHPGVFKFVGEFTIIKEEVTAHLGNESFTIRSEIFRKLLAFSEETGIGLLVHCDWGNPSVHSTDGRANPTISAYEHVSDLETMLREHPKAKIVLAHTGIGRLVRPDNSADRPGGKTPLVPVEVAPGKTELVPQHIAQLYKFASLSKNVRFDLSWNDAAEGLTADPALRKALADFIVNNPGRVLYGSDTVKPVNSGHYHQALHTLAPLLAELTYRSPKAAWRLLRGNYEDFVNRAEKRVQDWTRRQYELAGRGDELELMDAKQAVIKAKRKEMLATAKADFARWDADLRASAWWKARTAVERSPAWQEGPIAAAAEFTRLLRGDPDVAGHASNAGGSKAVASVYPYLYDTLPAPHPQKQQTKPYGLATSWGRTDTSTRTRNGVRLVARGVLAVGAGVAATFHLPHIDTINSLAFAVRGFANGWRATYLDTLRLIWERGFETGRFTHADLDRFVSRVLKLGPHFGVDAARLEQIAMLAEQFRIDMTHVHNRPLSAQWTEDQRFHVAMAEFGRFQINVDRVLGGLQASSVNGADARTPSGRALRAVVAGTFVLNMAATAHYFLNGKAFDVLSGDSWLHGLFAAGNFLLTFPVLAGWASGKSNRNWETRSAGARWTQAIGMSVLTAGGVAWGIANLQQAVARHAHPLWEYFVTPRLFHGLQQAVTLHEHPLATVANVALAGMDFMFARYLARSAETELRRVLRLPMPAPAEMTRTAQRASGLLIGRVLIGAIPIGAGQVVNAAHATAHWLQHLMLQFGHIPLVLQAGVVGAHALGMAAIPPIRRGLSARAGGPPDGVDPDTVARRQYQELTQSIGLTPQQADTMSEWARVHRDAVTGFYDARLSRLKSSTVRRARAHVQETGGDANFVSVDIANLSGLNAAMRNVAQAANVHLEALANIMASRLSEVGSLMVPMRTGGSRLGFVVMDSDEASLSEAIARAHDDVAQYAAQHGLTHIPPSRPEGQPGIGLHVGYTSIRPDKSLDQIFTEADAGVDDGSKRHVATNTRRTARADRAHSTATGTTPAGAAATSGRGTPAGQGGAAGPTKGGSPGDYQAADLTSSPTRFAQGNHAHASLDPAQARLQEFMEQAASAGLQPDQITAIAHFADAVIDDVTDFYDARHSGVKADAVRRLQRHVGQSEDNGFYVSADIANLGGLNEAMGNVAQHANVHFHAIAQHFLDGLAATGATVIPLRTGGDEFGAVVVGDIEEVDLQRALRVISQRTERYVSDHSLTDIPNPKRPEEVGVGLHTGYAEALPGRTLDSIFTEADLGVDASKKGQPSAVSGVDARTYVDAQLLAQGEYQRYALHFETDSTNVHRSPLCAYFAPRLLRKLMDAGFDSETTIKHVTAPDGRPHQYIETPQGIIIDPTWQQFLAPDALRPDAPKTLIVARTQLEAMLDALGVDPSVRSVWRQGSSAAVTAVDDEGWGWRGAEPPASDQSGGDGTDDALAMALPPGKGQRTAAASTRPSAWEASILSRAATQPDVVAAMARVPSSVTGEQARVQAALRLLEHEGVEVLLDGYAPVSIRHDTLYQIRSHAEPDLSGPDAVPAMVGLLRGVTARSTRIADEFAAGRIEVRFYDKDDGRNGFTLGNLVFINRHGQSSPWEQLLVLVHEGSHALDFLDGFGVETGEHAPGSPFVSGDREARAFRHQIEFARAMGLFSDPPLNPDLGTPRIDASVLNANHQIGDVHRSIGHYKSDDMLAVLPRPLRRPHPSSMRGYDWYRPAASPLEQAQRELSPDYGRVGGWGDPDHADARLLEAGGLELMTEFLAGGAPSHGLPRIESLALQDMRTVVSLLGRHLARHGEDAEPVGRAAFMSAWRGDPQANAALHAALREFRGRNRSLASSLGRGVDGFHGEVLRTGGELYGRNRRTGLTPREQELLEAMSRVVEHAGQSAALPGQSPADAGADIFFRAWGYDDKPAQRRLTQALEEVFPLDEAAQGDAASAAPSAPRQHGASPPALGMLLQIGGGRPVQPTDDARHADDPRTWHDEETTMEI